MNKFFLLISVFILILISACKYTNKAKIAQLESEKSEHLLIKKPSNLKIPEGMVWVPGVHFLQGAKEGDALASPAEKPAHLVAVDGFFIDVTEVTNAQFAQFFKETGYVTVAERPINWEELKKELPPGTPKPVDSVLQPGSLIFNRKVENVKNKNDYTQWWEWKPGADWKHPEGPESSIKNKDNYPVVHICYEDASAYCKWAHRRLPTEAEWEAAAHGKLKDNIYTWGNDESRLVYAANTWQGIFPVKNIPEDGFKYTAPVKSFDPNSLGIYDMAGNVWELTQDWFNISFYKSSFDKGELKNPKGANEPYNPNNPYEKEKVIKGGSFLCNASYCASYRISARMGQSLDSGSDHAGFRTVLSIDMIDK